MESFPSVWLSCNNYSCLWNFLNVPSHAPLSQLPSRRVCGCYFGDKEPEVQKAGVTTQSQFAITMCFFLFHIKLSILKTSWNEKIHPLPQQPPPNHAMGLFNLDSFTVIQNSWCLDQNWSFSCMLYRRNWSGKWGVKIRLWAVPEIHKCAFLQNACI